MRRAPWIPPVLWMAVIMWLASDEFSAEHTGRVLGPILSWLFPWASAAQLAALHQALRKLAHFAEYAILAALWFRAIAGRPPRRRAWIALAISVTWAFLDEAYQATTLTRTASAGDVALDTCGAVSALAVARAGWGPSLQALTTVLLWLAAGGGAIAIVVDAAAGVRPGWLGLTVPVAALALVLRQRRRASARDA